MEVTIGSQCLGADVIRDLREQLSVAIFGFVLQPLGGLALVIPYAFAGQPPAPHWFHINLITACTAATETP